MSVLRIEGSHRLEGTIKIQGSKNGVLPVMADTAFICASSITAVFPVVAKRESASCFSDSVT